MAAKAEPTPPTRPRVPPAFFEDLYANDEDPWGFATSPYERDKYAHSLRALNGRRFDSALEVGCSVGVLTEELADLCTRLLAIDVSEVALERARQRLGERAGVTFVKAAFPEEMPDGRWELVVCSEILYYLDAAAFTLALERLHTALEQGATILAVHWRGPTETYPLSGDEVHERLLGELGRWHVLDGRRERYRLDRFDGR